MEQAVITIKISVEEAEAYAQFLKRAQPEDYKRRAGDQKEQFAMERASLTIQNAFAKAGFAPR